MENKILAIVDGREVKESDLNSMMKTLGQNASYFKGEEGRKKLIEELVMHELIYSDAVENQLEKDEEFIVVMNNMKKSLLQQYGLNKIISQVHVSDDELAEYFEKNKNIYKTQETAKASHILVETEEEANNILEEITDGMSFEEAAKEYSSCPSKSVGGDLGQFGKGQMVPEFEQAVFSMKKGEISAPVKTQFGYHIIKLIDLIPERDSQLEEVKEEIRKQCTVEKQNQIYFTKQNEFKQKYKVEIFE